MNLGKRIRQVRGELSQAEFGNLLGISQSSVGVYEKGFRAPDSNVLNAICNKVDIFPEWLLMGNGPMYKKAPQTGDASPVSQPQKTQHTENIKSKKEMTGDASPVVESQREIMELFKKNMELQERLMAVMQENADLRVQAERNATRIRELERELEGARRDSGAGGGAVGETSRL